MMDSNTLNNLEDSLSIFGGNNVLRIARDEPWSVSVHTLLYRAVLPPSFHGPISTLRPQLYLL